MMTFGSLFAGVGGFDLGFERAGMECRWQVEVDPFCQRVLAKHWPAVPRFGDIREFAISDRDTLRVDVICGGFPCQDISYAGKGDGIDGERSGLWGEMFRVVCAVRPRIVVVENSAALIFRGLGRVLGDLAGIGFNAEWSVLSACAMGAPHVRRRLFIVAYADGVDVLPGFRDSIAKQDWSLQAVDGRPLSRSSWAVRLEDPSALYRDGDGVPDRMERGRVLGNAVVPQIAEWIGRRIVQANERALSE